jgi:hypothetical protein
MKSLIKNCHAKATPAFRLVWDKLYQILDSPRPSHRGNPNAARASLRIGCRLRRHQAQPTVSRTRKRCPSQA